MELIDLVDGQRISGLEVDKYEITIWTKEGSKIKAIVRGGEDTKLETTIDAKTKIVIE